MASVYSQPHKRTTIITSPVPPGTSLTAERSAWLLKYIKYWPQIPAAPPTDKTNPSSGYRVGLAWPIFTWSSLQTGNMSLTRPSPLRPHLRSTRRQVFIPGVLVSGTTPLKPEVCHAASVRTSPAPADDIERPRHADRRDHRQRDGSHWHRLASSTGEWQQHTYNIDWQVR